MPETKGISLERMDKLFGEVDAVAAGEEETAADKIEAMTYSTGTAGHVEHSNAPATALNDEGTAQEGLRQRQGEEGEKKV